jgi:hypothetical protein
MHNALVGSTCHPTPNAYLTDPIWLEKAPIIAKGIRAMPVICNYPTWWVSLSLDGYGSHVNIDPSIQIFTEHRIWIIKEKADSSQTNQAYNQLVAKRDKAKMRPLVDLVPKHCGVIDP